MMNRVSALRLAASGAITLSVLFALCWVATSIVPVGPSHMYISLFTAAPINSLSALVMGGLAALISGSIGGAILAWTYNLTAFVERSTP